MSSSPLSPASWISSLRPSFLPRPCIPPLSLLPFWALLLVLLAHPPDHFPVSYRGAFLPPIRSFCRLHWEPALVPLKTRNLSAIASIAFLSFFLSPSLPPSLSFAHAHPLAPVHRLRPKKRPLFSPVSPAEKEIHCRDQFVSSPLKLGKRGREKNHKEPGNSSKGRPGWGCSLPDNEKDREERPSSSRPSIRPSFHVVVSARPRSCPIMR